MEGSTLELYKELLRLRRELRLGRRSLQWNDDFGREAVSFSLNGGDSSAADDVVHVVANIGSAPLSLPEGAELVVASQPLASGPAGVSVPVDATAWFRLR